MVTIYPVASAPLTDDTISIQTALDEATDGVVLSPGVYTVSKTLKLRNRSGLRILGYGATIQTTINGTVLDVTGSTNLEIAGLRFLGSYSGADTPALQEAVTANPGVSGLVVRDCVFDTITVGVFVAGNGWSDVTIRNNKFLNTNAAIATGTGTGTNLKIQDNEFVDSLTLSSDDSIALAGQVFGVSITGNYINKSASGSVLRSHGILLGPTQGSGISHAVVAHNVIVNNTTSGANPRAAIEATDISGGQLNNIAIVENILDGDYIGISANPMTTDTILIRGNSISSPTKNGITGNASSATGAVIIADNVVVNPGDVGVYMANAANLVMSGNQVSGGANRGVVADTCPNVVYAGNRAWGNAGTNTLLNACTGALASVNYPTPVVQ